MIDLAVHVLNAFATSLPDAGDTATLVGRAPALIKVLPGRHVVCYIEPSGVLTSAHTAQMSRQRQYYKHC